MQADDLIKPDLDSALEWMEERSLLLHADRLTSRANWRRACAGPPRTSATGAERRCVNAAHA
jgi:hypothetical protein